MQKKYKQLLFVGIMILALLLIIFFLMQKNIEKEQEAIIIDSEKISEATLANLSPKFTQEEIKNSTNLRQAKEILDFLWNNNRGSGGIYTLWTECDNQSCSPSARSGNHAVVMWSRSKYVEATGDQEELERLKTDINNFAAIFDGLPADTTYSSSAFGCLLFMDIREKATYLPLEYREKLSNLCQRSVHSADIYSYYGRIHGYVKPMTEKELDALLEQLLSLPNQDNPSADDRVAHYEAQKIDFYQLLPTVDQNYLKSFNCNTLTPMVGGKCDALPGKNNQAYIYDERYAYLLGNQVTKTKYNLQPIFEDKTIKNQSFVLQEKALLADALTYYYTQPDTGRFFLGKSCLLRQEVLALAENTHDEKLSQTLKNFAKKENFFLPINDDIHDYWYLASLFECALADSFISPSAFSESLNLALSTWDKNPELNHQGVLAQPITNSNKVNIYTINNAMLAGVLAQQG